MKDPIPDVTTYRDGVIISQDEIVKYGGVPVFEHHCIHCDAPLYVGFPIRGYRCLRCGENACAD